MWILIILMTALATLLYGKDIGSRCNAPAVRKGDEASITCNFSDDVTREQTAVVVKHFAFGKDEMVLGCQWINGKAECFVRPTYMFDGTITDTLRISIPEATEDHVGIYACYVIPEQANDSEKCIFNLTVIESECEATEVDQGQCATIKCKFNHDLRRNHYKISVKHFAGDKDENVMLCQWTNGNEDCLIRPTYKFNGNISNQLIIQIPHATQDHYGEYVCYVLPAEPEHFKKCKLITKDYITTTPIRYNESCANCTLGNQTDEKDPRLKLLGLLAIIPVIGIIVMAIYLIRRKIHHQDPSTENSYPLDEPNASTPLNNGDGNISSSL